MTWPIEDAIEKLDDANDVIGKNEMNWALEI